MKELKKAHEIEYTEAKEGFIEEYSKIIAIIGDTGFGKTALATYLAYKAYTEEDANIIANYRLNFMPDDDYLMDLYNIQLLPPQLEGAIVITDEVQEGADSRKALSNYNIHFGKLATQLRKRNCIWILTTQSLDQIDSRIRKRIDFLIFPYKDNDEETGELIDDIIHVAIMNKKTQEIVREYDWDPKEFFKLDLYDTREIIDFEALDKIREENEDESTSE